MRWLYQGYAAPPDVAAAAVVPDQFHPEYPDFARRRETHAAFMPAFFFAFALAQLPVPDLSWAPQYPDFARSAERSPEFQAFTHDPVLPAPFPDQFYPDYPDFARAAEPVPLSEYSSPVLFEPFPEQFYPDYPDFARAAEPVPLSEYSSPVLFEAFPELSWEPQYPDFARGSVYLETASHPAISQSFFRCHLEEHFEGAGYEFNWSDGETVGGSSTLDEDTDTAEVGDPFGWDDQCLKAILVSSDIDAYVQHTFPHDIPETYTGIELIVTAEDLADTESHTVALAVDISDVVIIWAISVLQTSGNLELVIGIAHDGFLNDFVVPFNLNQCVRIEIKWDSIANEWEWRLDGVTQNSGTLTGAAVGRGLGILRVGLDEINAQGSTVYYDNICVDPLDFPFVGGKLTSAGFETIFPDFPGRGPERTPWFQFFAAPVEPVSPLPDLSWQPRYPDFARAAERTPWYEYSSPTLFEPFEELSWEPQYPDFARAAERVAWFQDVARPVEPEPFPELSWEPEFPDFAPEAERVAEFPAFAVEPIFPEPFPELSWEPEFPDFPGVGPERTPWFQDIAKPVEPEPFEELSWEPEFPDFAPAAERTPWFQAEVSRPVLPEPFPELSWRPSYPDFARQAERVAEFPPFFWEPELLPAPTAAIDWLSIHPDFARRLQSTPWLEAYASPTLFEPFPELSWGPEFPDFARASERTPEFQAYAAPELTIPPLISGWEPQYPDFAREAERVAETQSVNPVLFEPFEELSWEPEFPDFARILQARPWLEAYASPTLFEAFPELSWEPEYPDFARGLPSRPELEAYASPVLFEPFEELSWEPEFPDQLPAPHIVPPQEVFVRVVEAAPDLSWQPRFPDSAREAERVVEFPFLSWNPETPAPAVVPDFFGPQSVDIILPVPFPESQRFEPVPFIAPRIEHVSRGIYDWDRGHYHTPAISTGEPHAVANDVIGGTQSVADGSTLIVLQVGLTLVDPWTLYDAPRFGFVIRHPGYYTTGGWVEWASDAVGVRNAEIVLTDDAGIDLRSLAQTSQNAVSGLATRQNLSGQIFLMQVGWYVTLRGFQTSGGPLNADFASLWLQRVAPPDTILPT